MSEGVNKAHIAFTPSNNCLNFIRLFAALQVMIKHLVVHIQAPIPQWLYGMIGFFGGVPIFFAISGMLIWFSLKRNDNLKQYAKKRFLRIYPELWLGVLIELITIVALYRDWNPVQLAAFTVTQGTFLQFWTPESLHGYGCGTPNGALWTIGVTVQFYILVWFLYKLMRNKRLWVWLVGFICTIGISYFGHIAMIMTGSEILVKFFSQTIFRYLWLFYIGCFIAEHFDRIIPTISKLWYVFLCVAVIPHVFGFGLQLGNYNLLWALPLCIGIIGFAYRFPKIRIKTDISYGLFIYHMIVANVFISIGAIGNWYYLVLVAVISCLLAYSSMLIFNRSNHTKKAA